MSSSLDINTVQCGSSSPPSSNLTDTSCVFIDSDREVWLATEMCAEYTESSVDQIVVLNKNNIIGTVGGYDLLAHIRKNPTRRFQYESKVEEIMFSPVPKKV